MQQLMRDWVTRYCRTLRLPRSSVILDAGCGGGELAEDLVPGPPRPSKIILSDANPKSVEDAAARVAAKAKRERSNSPVEVETAVGLLPEVLKPEWQGQVSLAVSLQVLMHVPFELKEAVIAGLIQTLKPGGHLVLSVITEEWAKRRFPRGDGEGVYLIPDGEGLDPHPEYYCDLSVYTRLLEKHGVNCETTVLSIQRGMKGKDYKDPSLWGLPVWHIFTGVREF
jgi:2-polyprenyl-3-methyl-5-hydroxy-6-metoxy-1,4-benzoquinol methylase